MFDFEKLDLYTELKQLNLMVFQTLQEMENLDDYVLDQWKRASLDSVLHLVEGTGSMTIADKRQFYTHARGSVFECVAILDMIHQLGQIDDELYQTFYAGYEKTSKMLLGMYRSQQ